MQQTYILYQSFINGVLTANGMCPSEGQEVPKKISSSFLKWQLALKRGGRSAQLQIIETRSLGGRHALYVVGYQQQRLLLASSPAGVTLVSHLPGADAPEPGKNAIGDKDSVSSQNFVQVLQQAVQAKA